MAHSRLTPVEALQKYFTMHEMFIPTDEKHPDVRLTQEMIDKLNVFFGQYALKVTKK